MGRYDFFVANLVCPVCGQTTPADTSTNMQTYLREGGADLSSLRIGDRLPLDAARIRANDYDGYMANRVPEPGEPIRILVTWECPNCGTAFHWAMVVVRDGVIEDIVAVPFDRAHFEQSHLVSDDALFAAAELTGKSYAELVKLDLIQVLRERL